MSDQFVSPLQQAIYDARDGDFSVKVPTDQTTPSPLEAAVSEAAAYRHPTGAHVPLFAFNLFKGAAFYLTDGDPYEVWVVVNLWRAIETEDVFFVARECTDAEAVVYKTFGMLCTDSVNLVGNVVNYKDINDNDWGQH